MDEPYETRRGWGARFAGAVRGVRQGVAGQASFQVHVPAALAVFVAALVLRTSPLESALLALCVAVVLAAELFNSALETLAKAVDRRYNPQLGRALDIASGAVLVVAIGAAVAGLLTLGARAWMRLSG